MASVNRVFLMGNLTRDPEVRYTPKGTAVGDLGLAISHSYRTAEGEMREEVCFVDVEVWGRQAETCKQYLAKGRGVFVEGRLKFDQWEKDGQKKNKLSVRADRVQFIGGSRGDSSPSDSERFQEGGARRKEFSSAASAPAQSAPSMPVESDDDIPF